MNRKHNVGVATKVKVKASIDDYDDDEDLSGGKFKNNKKDNKTSRTPVLDSFSKDLTKMVVQSWIAGYITAYNSWQEVVTKKKDTDVIGTTDIDGVWQSVLNYCRANPLQNVNDAMGDIIDKLDTQQKRKR